MFKLHWATVPYLLVHLIVVCSGHDRNWASARASVAVPPGTTTDYWQKTVPGEPATITSVGQPCPPPLPTPAPTPGSSTTTTPAPPAVPAGMDNAMLRTMSIHHYRKDPDVKNSAKLYMVISNLAEARRCNVNNTVECYEAGTQKKTVDGRELCLKSNLAAKAECIHHAECKDEMFCLFLAKKDLNGDWGDIEDPRRYCGGTSHLLPSHLVLVVLLTLAMGIVTA